MQDSTDAVRHLAALGFTEIEAAVYAYLVAHPPATAYRVAQEIGKPVANTYKAVADLRQKGAVLVDETGSRTCRAVPPAELLDRLEAAYRQRHAAAAQALARLPAAGAGEGIYTLTRPEQVLERAAGMLEQAEEVVLIDAFPGVLEVLRASLEAAAARGVLVVVQAYADVEVNGVEVVLHRFAERALERWPGQWTCVVVDGSEYLFAYLNGPGTEVHQAIWSASPFLAWLQHSYLSQSLRLAALEGAVARGGEDAAPAEEVARTARWLALDAPGYGRLRARFEPPS